jgi:hypothetical protein
VFGEKSAWKMHKSLSGVVRIFFGQEELLSPTMILLKKTFWATLAQLFG